MKQRLKNARNLEQPHHRHDGKVDFAGKKGARTKERANLAENL